MECDQASARGTALCLSNEAHGTARLPELLDQLARDDDNASKPPSEAPHGVIVKRVCVPMSNGVDSLNVATAGAILMHQLGGAKLRWE
jgi:hypothetical protein